ncbi:hypothetical protein [Spongiimicrobium sp. 3-5]|uniref:hypothetical protein n=1 Tax=Spongiimicrobium sp. 3-5 TaxID=3332596 RepID=UPI003980BF85
MIKRYKIGLTFFLVMFSTIIIKNYLPLKRSNAEITNEFWIKKTHQKAKKNIVIGGNSRIYRGVSVESVLSAIDESLTGVNLGYSALGYNDEYLDFLLSRLDTKSKTKIVVLGIDPGPLTDIAAENKSFKSYKKVNYSEVLKTLYINPFFSISAYRPSEIAKLFVEDTTNLKGFIEVRENYFGKYDKDGWVASYKIPSNPSEALPVYKKFATDNNVVLSKKIIENLLLRLADFRKQDIDVVAFRPPSTKAMQEWENKEFGFDEKKIRNEIEKIGGYWIDINTSNFQSYDGSHLHYSSAENLSKLIGEKINELCISKNKLQ